MKVCSGWAVLLSMMMRCAAMVPRVVLTAVFSCLTALPGVSADQAVVEVKRPNILFFLVDDMGWQDTSVPFHHDAAGEAVKTPLNGRYRTPSMEALAASGMKFTRAYAHPVCTPTRVSWLTGKNAARHHVTNWTSPDGFETGDTDLDHLRSPRGWSMKGVSKDETTLPALLGRSGYRTIHVGKGHFGSRGAFGEHPQAVGFKVNIAGSEIGHPGSYTGSFGKGSRHAVTGLDAYHGSGVHLSEALTIEMNKAISAAVADGVPFFAYMAHYAVHSPFEEDERFADHYPGLTARERAYATLIEGMDRSLGKILEHLEELGVAEETLVVFLSDNGGDAPMADGNAPLRAKKAWAYEGGIRVPMIVSWARTAAGHPLQAALPIQPGSHETDLVHVTDVFPTLLAVAGCEAVGGIDGFDLTSYLRGEGGPGRPQRLVTHFPHNHNDRFFSVLHEGEWKLIHRYEDGSYELYQLAEDIGERRDLAAAEPARVAEMARVLAAELERMGAQYPWNRTTKSPQGMRLPVPP